ncbi:uncharacterized protein LOC142623786 [Castanea sativa]|uniref:uncharacterized protein LOC142623786 n=1 Tax=Castanea sativa TaxID=21020 RepID=UPI003F65310E
MSTFYLSIIGDAIGSMLAQEDDEKNERAVYYLSNRYHDYETWYTPIENSCFALVWAVQKLSHIVFPFQIWVVAKMDPLKYLFEKPILSGILSRWLILLAKFNLKYVARKTIKGSVVSDFCAKNHIPLAIKLNFEATNNMAEYEACIAGMEAFQELGVKEVEVFGDST